MDVSERDRALLGALQRGLPLVARPYAAVGQRIGMAEEEVMSRLASLKSAGVIRRLGVIVRHHELGYRANAMNVWALPEDRVDAMGRRLAEEPDVSLCYRRRCCVEWPYNLYCMIHGRDRQQVLAHRQRLAEKHDLDRWPHEVLFSGRRFKQRGAWYRPEDSTGTRAGADHG